MTTLKPTERLILMYLRSASAPQSIADIAVGIESTPITVMKLTQRLCRLGFLTRTKISR
jgi:DNA-binding MarR family transcriptional regulator